MIEHAFPAKVSSQDSGSRTVRAAGQGAGAQHRRPSPPSGGRGLSRAQANTPGLIPCAHCEHSQATHADAGRHECVAFNRVAAVLGEIKRCACAHFESVEAWSLRRRARSEARMNARLRRERLARRDARAGQNDGATMVVQAPAREGGGA